MGVVGGVGFGAGDGSGSAVVVVVDGGGGYFIVKATGPYTRGRGGG